MSRLDYDVTLADLIIPDMMDVGVWNWNNPFASAAPYAPPPPSTRLCETCAHWRPREPEGAEQPIFGRCVSPRVVYGRIPAWPPDAPPAVEYAPNPNTPDMPRGHIARHRESMAACSDMLLYADDEGYDAELLTGRYFGCVHWSAK